MKTVLNQMDSARMVYARFTVLTTGHVGQVSLYATLINQYVSYQAVLATSNVSLMKFVNKIDVYPTILAEMTMIV